MRRVRLSRLRLLLSRVGYSLGLAGIALVAPVGATARIDCAVFRMDLGHELFMAATWFGAAVQGFVDH
jgi:hypothetical protein